MTVKKIIVDDDRLTFFEILKLRFIGFNMPRIKYLFNRFLDKVIPYRYNCKWYYERMNVSEGQLCNLKQEYKKYKEQSTNEWIALRNENEKLKEIIS